MIRQEQCNKVCRILDDVLANRPTERDSLILAVRKAFEALEKQRWVPCSERLPEDFKKVLVFWWEHSEPMIDTAFWQKDAKRFDGQHWVRIEDKITHWMPLPEPYQEGSRNDSD